MPELQVPLHPTWPSNWWREPFIPEGARIVIKKDGIAQAYIQPANPNMSEDMYEALLALRSIPVAPNFDSEQMRAWMEEDRR